MARSEFASIDAYITAQPKAAHPALRRVRGIIGKAVPAAEEAISYNIPTFEQNGRTLLHFAG
jgi:uncharacterized protein YdhG (YjbR/CyaY superfamily)